MNEKITPGESVDKCVGTFVDVKHMSIEWCDIHKQQARACRLADEVSTLRAQLAAEKERGDGAERAHQVAVVFHNQTDAKLTRMKSRAEAAEAALAKEKEDNREWRIRQSDMFDINTRSLKHDIAALTKKVAGLTAAIDKFMPLLLAWESDYEKFSPEEYIKGASSSRCDLYLGLHSFQKSLKDTAPILAAHDAAKQAELVEALTKILRGCDASSDGETEWERDVADARAILARYPKAAKGDA